jgi:hypothetical protein
MSYAAHITKCIHTDRRHHAKGLCEPCYRLERTSKLKALGIKPKNGYVRKKPEKVYRDRAGNVVEYYYQSTDFLNYKNYSVMSRKAQKLKATPKWADLDKIKEIYRNRPEGYHVDHIIPLVSSRVCGLHVEHNLQYLPASENIRKKNNF